ncbi:AraC family transcriptional regulator [Sedimentitalea sp. CY04]|uniref:AraC family transcriptional regulator n=1 Tax=Parasedimentitalea denitrificans TaxID=2211118 RepID=A0ABX0WC79_9RHOB|nr:AraC family transcriptional regulator [Sedimentitalea sp. CY04]NIZ63247.1 AraC family transcriptional regulator [Sedimentitalea sp. CY04]
MPSVTSAFARAMAKAAGMTLTDDGALLSDGSVVFRVSSEVDGQIVDTDYFDLIDWIRETQPDEVALVEAYASSIQTDDLGVLGLAIRTAPTLRASLQRVERYFRLITDTAVYQLDEHENRAFWVFQGQTQHRAALELRNECALAGFARNMHRFVGPGLVLEYVSFRHSCRCETERYSEHFGCPVKFDADRDAIAVKPEMLDLANLLSDKAVSEYLTGHLEAEIKSINQSPSFSDTLLHNLTPMLSNGVPQAAEIARDMGMSERTLYRRLAEEGLTFRDVLAKAQLSLAQGLLRDDTVSIAEIAFLTGFSEQSTFSRAFKRWVGKAPAQFRQQFSAV